MPERSARGASPVSRSRERGQSELVGYAILFSLALTALVVTVVFGLAALEDVQQSTVVDNGEFALRAVESDVDALYRGSATTRRTELSLKSASLETGAETTVTVSVDDPSDGDPPRQFGPFTFRPIVYSSEQVDFVYENSLVVRDQRQGAVAVTDSEFVVSSDQTVVPVVQTVAEPQSVGGSATGSVDAVVNRTRGYTVTNRTFPSDAFVVTVEIDTAPDRVRVWNRTLSDAVAETTDLPVGGSPGCEVTDRANGVLECDIETTAVVVSRVEITYSLQ